MNNKLLDRINYAIAQEPKNIQQEFLKLMEEIGEASQAYLSSKNASGSKYKGLSVSNTKEELIDALLVTFTLLKKLGTTDTEIKYLLSSKTAKWIDKQHN